MGLDLCESQNGENNMVFRGNRVVAWDVHHKNNRARETGKEPVFLSVVGNRASLRAIQ